MTTLEIILTAIIWIAYGVFNSWQHDWFKDYDPKDYEVIVLINIIFAPVALMIRLYRGIFYYKLPHD